MTSHRYGKWLRDLWHPSDRELLLYLNGELESKALEKIRSHLEGCWSCGVKREKFLDAISAFMSFRGATLGGNSDCRPEAQQTFAARLSRLAAESGKPSLLSNLMAAVNEGIVSRFSLRQAIWILATVVIALCMIRLSSVLPVSAKELLERTQNAEGQRIRQVSTPVIYQKLQILRSPLGPERQQSLVWEIWNDTSRVRFAEGVADAAGHRLIPGQPRDSEIGETLPTRLQQKDIKSVAESSSLPKVLDELKSIFETNGMDRRKPLSPSSYQAWRKSIRFESEGVAQTSLPDGEEAFILKTVATGPFAPKAIVEAEWMVRAGDWHPVEQRLKVQEEQGPRDYQLTEIAYQLLALNTLPPSIFLDIPSPSSVEVPRAPVLSARPLPSESELMSAEIEARYALHRVKACLGEPIEVVRDASDRVQVHGLVQDVQRKQELLAALRDVPLIRLNLQTVEEASPTASAVRSDTEQSERSGEDISLVQRRISAETTKLPVQEQLERYFRQVWQASPDGKEQDERIFVNGQIIDFSNEAMSLWKAALSEAWALRRLAEGHDVKPAALRPHVKWLLEVMLRDHFLGLKTAVGQSQKLLQPVLSSFSPDISEKQTGVTADEMEPSAKLNNSSWAAECLSLFFEIEQMDRIIYDLFAATGTVEHGEESSRELLEALTRLESKFQGLEAKIASDFLVNPAALSLKRQE